MSSKLFSEPSPERLLSWDASPNATPLPGESRSLKIALAQINTVTGDIESNSRKIKATMQHAATHGADLVLFPEMTLTGYPPRDMLDMPSFVDACLRSLVDIAQETRGVAAIIGHVERNPEKQGKALFNSASLVHEGVTKVVCRKTLLPTYDVFDEARWFQPGPEQKPYQFGPWNLGVSICEDIWIRDLHASRRLYDVDPIANLAGAGAQVLINISASPYRHARRHHKMEMFSSVARDHCLPLFHVNSVGGNDSLIFDGGSTVHDSEGRLIYQAPHFEEHFGIVDVAHMPGEVAATEETLGDVHKALVLGTRDYMRKCGFKKAVIGLSGGIDSAVTAALAVEALGPENVMGVTMPSVHSSKGSVSDSKALAQNLGIEMHEIPIKETVSALEDSIAPLLGEGDLGVTSENLQARARGVILMAISNKTGAIVLTTGNKSEMAVGYCTLYGDMCGGLAVLSDVPKTMVYDLARHINRHGEIIPTSTIEKPPSAELRPEQRDSDSLPPYDILDPIIQAHVEEHLSAEEIIDRGHDEEIVRRVLRLITLNEYKRRQAPPGLRVTSKAFSDGWRMPIARGKFKM